MPWSWPAFFVSLPDPAGRSFDFARRGELPDRVAVSVTPLSNSDPTQAPALDRFPEWRDTEPVPRDAPWPDTGGWTKGLALLRVIRPAVEILAP